MSLYTSYAVTSSSICHLLFVFKRFIDDSCLKYFLATVALCCVTQNKGKSNRVKRKRLAFYRRYPSYFSLTLLHSRPTKSLTAFLRQTGHLTLTLLRTRSKRTSCLRICLFHEILQPTLDEIRKRDTKQKRKNKYKKTRHFLDHLYITCDKQPSASCYPSCTPSGRIRRPTEFFISGFQSHYIMSKYLTVG